MHKLTDRQLAIGATIAAIASMVFAGLALRQSYRQFDQDYEPAVVLSPGAVPIREIPSSPPLEISVEVTNTSKVDLRYFLRAESNSACITGNAGREVFFPCKFESEIISLSKPEAGRHTYAHKLKLQAPPSVEMPVLAYSSEPKYYVTIDVIDARNGRSLKRSSCYYSFVRETKSLSLYRPVLDTSGESTALQAACEG